MIDHFNLPVSDMAASRVFYDAVLGTLGVSVLIEEDGALGYGAERWAFGLVADPVGAALHVGFRAQDKAAVDAFYRAGLSAGGRCNGAPGERAQYGAGYYACYLRDPDGHNVEAVFRG